MNTKGSAPRAIIDLIASMLPDRIITRPSAASTSPQLSLTRVLGLRSPPVENMPSTNAALTTLVTRNRKAAIIVAAMVRKDNGNWLRT